MCTEPEPLDDRGDYDQLVERVRALVERSVPAGACALVVSRGDGRLLDVRARRIGHFPQTPTGLYAGHYPPDGDAAVEELERLRAAGARYLVIPDTGRWWLEYYAELRTWLETWGVVAAEEPETGIVFRLAQADESVPGSPEAARVIPHAEMLIAALLPPETGVVLVASDTEGALAGRRFQWVIPAPSARSGLGVGHVMERIEDARRAGADYLALVNPAEPWLVIDRRLSRRLAARFRSICRRRLIEVFALTSGASGG